jgi:hypothetical protein
MSLAHIDFALSALKRAVPEILDVSLSVFRAASATPVETSLVTSSEHDEVANR